MKIQGDLLRAQTMAGIASEFRVEQFYSNDLISNLLSVGNAGGIRPSLRADGSIRRLVLLTALPLAKVAAENPYHDRVESDILIYTGKGLRGNQEPGGLNRRLVEQLNEHFPVVFSARIQSTRQEGRQGPLEIPWPANAHTFSQRTTARC